MQNGDKALPFLVAKPNHRFTYMCLDNVKMYLNLVPTFVRNLFQKTYVETLSLATRTLL